MLVLSAFLALGMGLSVVKASDMTLKMATMSDAGMSADGGCDDCGGGGDEGAGVSTCSPLMSCSAMVATLPLGSSLSAALAAHVSFSPSDVAYDQLAPPEPYPPRSRDLG